MERTDTYSSGRMVEYLMYLMGRDRETVTRRLLEHRIVTWNDFQDYVETGAIKGE